MKGTDFIKFKILFAVISGIFILTGGASAYDTGAFLSNNVSEYNAGLNQVKGDTWSYLRYNGKISEAWKSSQLFMAVKNQSVLDDRWYFANNKSSDWYIEPGGKMKTDAGRIMIFNYTVGEKTAGKDLKISGSLTGAAATDLYIFKTDDSIEHADDYGKSAVVLDENFNRAPLAYYENLPENGESFEIEIPAAEAGQGNDIMFWCEVESGAYVVNTLNVSVEEVKFFTLSDYEFTDSTGNEVKKITSDMDGITISTIVSNHLYRPAEVVLGAALYDGDTDAVKAIFSSEDTVEHGQNKKISASCESEKWTALNIKNSDYIKIYAWDGFGSMTPINNETVFPEQISPYAKNILDFVGVNGNQTDMSLIGDIRWCRTDFSWQSVEPEKGNIKSEQLKSWGDRILKQRENGITMLPILDYCADWAADPAAYSFEWGGSLYEYSEAEAIEGSTTLWKRTKTVTKSDGTSSSSEVNTRKSRDRFADAEDWKNYVELIVSTYSKAPYNLEYFQIWNEAHPASGFYNGGMDYYMEYVHKPAAEIIRKYGCKVVYGGWPSCGGHGNYFNYLDKYDAWKTIDVFSMHYYSLDAMDQLYNRALKAGVKSPCVWQTEIGWEYNNTGFVAAQYPRMFYWALQRRSEQNDQFKPIFFSWACPNSADAYGYNKNLTYTDGTITKHGYSMKNLIDLLKGNNVERYTDITTDAALGNAVTGNSLIGFEVDSKRVVLNAAISPVRDAAGEIVTPAESFIAGIPITLSGIYGAKSVKLVSYTGLDCSALSYSDDGNGNITFEIPEDLIVPVQKGVGSDVVGSVYLYVVVEADRVAARRNNIKDFELGSRQADNKCIIAAGRWSYLDGHYSPPSPLAKGTGKNSLFSAGEWVVDNAKSNKAWSVSQTGAIYTDTRPMVYNYTIDKDMAGKNIVISGRFTPNSKNRDFRIVKTMDSDETSIGAVTEEIYSYSGRAVHDFEVMIPADKVSFGNDVMFFASSASAGDYQTAMSLDVSISID